MRMQVHGGTVPKFSFGGEGGIFLPRQRSHMHGPPADRCLPFPGDVERGGEEKNFEFIGETIDFVAILLGVGIKVPP